MAPEQWDNGDWTAATDQFAFAVIVYYCLTGVVPFEGQDHPEIRRRNFARGPVPAHEETSARIARPRLQRQTSEVLQKALSIEPELRFASVGQFVRALITSLETRDGRPYTYDVFISYVRKRDSGWASLFARELKEKHGMSVFLDVEFRDGAGRFPDKLSKAIEGSKVFMCFLNAGTLNSKWVTQEIQVAHQFQVPMIPVFQESFQTPVSIEALDPSIDTLLQSDGVHLMDERNVHIDHSVRDVADLVKRTIGRQPR
jgi:serine/threonine protein kinase